MHYFLCYLPKAAAAEVASMAGRSRIVWQLWREPAVQQAETQFASCAEAQLGAGPSPFAVMKAQW